MKKLITAMLMLTMLSNVSYSQDASLSESLDWVKGKLEAFKYSRYGTVGINYWDKYTYTMSFTECELKITQKYSYVEDAPWSRNDYTRETVYVFSLSELKSIDYDANADAFIIKTYNDKKVIVADDTRIENEFRIRVTDLGDLKGQPERFLKAFRHAMNLCGAKKEAF